MSTTNHSIFLFFVKFQGQPTGMPPRGPRGDWNRPPMHQGFHQASPGTIDFLNYMHTQSPAP